MLLMLMLEVLSFFYVLSMFCLQLNMVSTLAVAKVDMTKLCVRTF